jgi:PIN domain nuclease of toxin-antitoxin system
MTAVVLDSSAVLAVVHDERGSEVVIASLADALLSAVNFAETISKLIERDIAVDVAAAIVQGLGLTIIDFDRGLAVKAGSLRAQTKHLGLSLADRACLALAERKGVPALTGDQKWSRLDIGIDIRMFR